MQHNADAVEDAVWAEVERILSNPDLLREAAGLGMTAKGGQWEADIAAVEKELKTCDRQKQNLVWLFSKELIDEADVERQLKELRGQVLGAQHRKDALVSQRDAAAVMQKASWDINRRVRVLAKGIESATLEQRREPVAAIFPKVAPFGLRLFPDGRIEAIGVLAPLPEDPSAASGGAPGDEGHKTTCARRWPGSTSRRRPGSSRAARAPASPARRR